jgi:aerobic-type carbon monoxide dehydrogenase small subunit (CoxS/CutS family)
MRLNVNGEMNEVQVPPSRSLASVLRDDLGLTGTKLGCAQGRCGSCTVLLDGEPVVSCLLPVCLVEDRPILTVEGLGGPGENALQAAFAEVGAVQCGMCTPGMLMAATALLRRCPRPTPPQVRQELVGNLCRCTGYAAIVEAVCAAGAEEEG